MLLSAVSLGLCLLVAPQSGGLGRQDVSIADRLNASVITILDQGVAKGSAVLIDRSGLFVAHSNTVSGAMVDGRMPSGSLIRLKLVGRDGATQLVLLQAPYWESSSMRPVVVPPIDPPPGSSLILMFPAGAVSAQSFQDGVAVLSNSRRLVPVREIRFEAPIQSVASALIFTRSGEFLGALNATLATAPSNAQNFVNNQQVQSLRGFPVPSVFAKANRNFGPAVMTVAYIPGTDLVRKVVDGFRTPSHQVEHPWLGVMCTNSPDSGALVTRVVPNSPASYAHVQINDVILQIGLEPVRNQVDFFKAMLRQKPGAKITLHLKRDGKSVLVDVIIGETTSPS